MGQDMGLNPSMMENSFGGINFDTDLGGDALETFDFDSFLSMGPDIPDGFEFDPQFLDTSGGVAAGNE